MKIWIRFWTKIAGGIFIWEGLRAYSVWKGVQIITIILHVFSPQDVHGPANHCIILLLNIWAAMSCGTVMCATYFNLFDSLHEYSNRKWWRPWHFENAISIFCLKMCQSYHNDFTLFLPQDILVLANPSSVQVLNRFVTDKMCYLNVRVKFKSYMIICSQFPNNNIGQNFSFRKCCRHFLFEKSCVLP